VSDQASFGDFTDTGEDDERPAAEAAAVAGKSGGVAEVVTEDSRYPPADRPLKLAVTQVNYTVEGRGDEEYPVVHVFGRTPDGTREHVRVLEFEPYFYTPTADLDEDPVGAYGSVLDTRETGPDGEPFESIRGERLTKVVARTPRDVGSIRDDFVTTYEADILFPNRFLIDLGVGGGVAVPERRLNDGRIQVHHSEVDPAEVDADLRVNTFDIEVDDRNGFPEDGEEPIVCLTSHDSYRDEYVLWLYEAPSGEGSVPDTIEDYEQINRDADVDVRTFEREGEMLHRFVEYIDETDPDVVTGWNCLPADSDVQMADGTTQEIRAVEPGDAVAGSDGQTPTTATVTNKWRSETEILEFDLADGTTLRSSPDHRIMVGDGETVDWTEGAELEPGDHVLKPRTLPVDESTVPTLSELVPLENQRFADEGAVEQFNSQHPQGATVERGEESDITAETLYHPRRDVWTSERCSNASTRYDVALPDGGRDYRRTGTDLDREFHEHEAYLAGLILTDGSMSEIDGIRFFNSQKELHEAFPGDSPLRPDGTGCYQQTVLDDARMYAFNGLGIPFEDRTAGPIDLSAVYQMPDEYVARFLAGVIDGDGSVGPIVTVTAESESIGDWYVRLFKRLGVYAERDESTVRIPDAERDCSTLREQVWPHMRHPEKADRLVGLSGEQSGQTEDIPYGLPAAKVDTGERRRGRAECRRGIGHERYETDVDEWDEYVFVKVEDVKTVGTETTYDLETTTHNFVAEGCLVHNCEEFDVPYVLDRMEEIRGTSEYELSPDRFSRVDEVWRGGWGGPNIKGRVVFDLLYAYKRTQFTELESYRLDAVAELELDVGKERYSGNIGDLWEQEPERLLEYNLRDVELCVEIDRKQSVIAFWDEVRRFVGCLLEDAPTPGDAVDVYVLHNAYGRFALPTKGQQESEEFEGGAVFEPVTGVRENVTVLDLKSLYPMCMVTINASPETKVDREAYDGETYHAPNGTHFRAEPDGMMREMVDELLTEREEKKTRRDQHEPGTDEYVLFNRQQAATKVIMNSLYGVSGWDRFRLYDKENAAAVTATGREVLSFTEDVAGEIDYQIAYGDSVTGDRPVVVRDSDGLVRILPIEDLFERAKIRPEAEVLITADGGAASTVGLGKERGTLDGWDALSVNDAGDAEWQPIEEVVRHETDDPVVRLRHKFGESTTTRDHSYVVEDGDAFTEAPPEDVSEPLRVPGFPNVERIETLDVYEVLQGYDREYASGRDDGDNRTKIKRVHADDEWVWFGHEHARHQSKPVRVKRQIDLNGKDGRALVRLLAAYVTEGSASTAETTDSRFGASIAESRREWLDGLKRDYQRLFDGVATSLVTSDVRDDRTVEYETNAGGESVTYDDCTIQLQMMNELSAVFFRELAGQTSRGKRIPSFVFHLSDELQTLFLDTLVEGDGSREFPRYSEAYAEQNVDFETTSRELAAGLSMLLTQRGRKHSLKYHDAKESYTVRTCDSYCEGHAPELTEFDHHDYVYDLSVAENENFVDAVGGVVLHNTDSVMLELGSSVTKSEAIDLSFDIEAHINDRYDDFARERLGAEEHRFQIEFEKLYRRFFQAGKKKRYAGHIVWKEGNDVDDIDITGFEYKRSDIAQVTKRVQREVIEMIVRGEDLDEVKDFLHQEITTFESGERSLAEVGIPGGIGKRLDAYDTDTAQVRGARYANELLGTNFGRGSKPKRVYLRKVHPDFFRHLEDEEGLDPASDPVYAAFKRDPDVICFEYDDQVPDEFEVDWERMLEKTLQGPIARVIEALGMSWDEVRSGQTQTGLGQFG
jgi:DNA polymerase I